MRIIYKALVYSNIWVSLAVACLCYITMESFVRVNGGFLAFVIAATAFSYNYMRLVQLHGYSQSGDANLKSWAREHRPLIWIYTILFGVLAGLYFWRIYEPRLVWLLALPALVSMVYPLTFQNIFRGFTSLRAVPGLKMFLISLTWSYVTVLVPAALYDGPDNELIFEFILRTFLILGLVIPFDIRDVDLDAENMQTLPQQLGIERAKQIAMFFVGLYQIWLLVRVFAFGYSLTSAVALILGFEVGFWLIKKSAANRGESYYSFWLEAVPIIALLFLLLGHWFF